MANVKRVFRHLLMTRWRVNRAFPSGSLAAIEKAIGASEKAHTGEIRFAVEGALDGMRLFRGQSARERAIELFSQLRVWDTEHNNGVLIYLLLADRSVEIVADRGVHAKVGSQGWGAICREMEGAFGLSNYKAGVCNGIEAVAGHLGRHYPGDSGRRNQLPDAPLVL